MPRRPNVLVFLIDDLDLERIPFYSRLDAGAAAQKSSQAEGYSCKHGSANCTYPPQRADPFAVAETVGTGMLALGVIFLLRVLYLGARALGRTVDAGEAEPSPRARAAEAVRGGHAGVPPPRAKKKGRARYAPCPPERDAEIEVAASEAGGERAPPEREPFTDL